MGRRSPARPADFLDGDYVLPRRGVSYSTHVAPITLARLSACAECAMAVQPRQDFNVRLPLRPPTWTTSRPELQAGQSC